MEHLCTDKSVLANQTLLSLKPLHTCARSPVMRFFEMMILQHQQILVPMNFDKRKFYNPLTNWGLALPGVSWRCIVRPCILVFVWHNEKTSQLGGPVSKSWFYLILHLPFWALSPRQCLSINNNHWQYPKTCVQVPDDPYGRMATRIVLSQLSNKWTFRPHLSEVQTLTMHYLWWNHFFFTSTFDKLLSLRITSYRVNPQTNSSVQGFLCVFYQTNAGTQQWPSTTLDGWSCSGHCFCLKPIPAKKRNL